MFTAILTVISLLAAGLVAGVFITALAALEDIPRS
jgi:hypothetical protein